MFNKIKVVEKVKTEKRRNMDVLVLKYQHMSGKFEGAEWSITALAVALPPGAKETLLRAKPGDVLWMEQASKDGVDKDGNPKTYYSIGDISTAAPEGSENKKSAFSHKSDSKSSQSSKSYDDVGVKVGAARNQALEVLKLVGKKYKSTDEVLKEQRKVSDEIVRQQAEQEDDVRNGRLEHSPTEDLENYEDDDHDDPDF